MTLPIIGGKPAFLVQRRDVEFRTSSDREGRDWLVVRNISPSLARTLERRIGPAEVRQASPGRQDIRWSIEAGNKAEAIGKML